MEKQIKLGDGRTVTMREPTVGDSLASIVKDDERMSEVNFISNLTGLSVEEIKKLTLKDYAKLQDGFLGFL